MLKELRLINIVLVESAAIPFSQCFNVLSGESGSGKSAIMNALNLIAGERCDAGCVRHGEEKGIVEAIFDISNIPQLVEILEEAGIDHEKGSELFIRREISSQGKSRAFINNQLAQLTLLKRVTPHLFEIVGQHANQKLLSLDYHREVLDLFANTEDELEEFFKSWQEEKTVREQLEKLVRSESQRMRDLEIARMELEELEQANLKEGEEEEVYVEYTQLSNADELSQRANDILNVLNGEKIGVLIQIGRQKSSFEQLKKLVPHLTEVANSYENALLELHEVEHTLRNFASSIEHNPERATQLDARLEQIHRIKRKYGPSIEEVHAYYIQTKTRLEKLENADADIEYLQKKLMVLAENTNAFCVKLSSKRKTGAKKLQEAVVQQLRNLNMPKVEFFVDITAQKRTRYGDDKIEFYLIPNIGEHRVPLRDCASGGELSRTMLAIQTLLAGKEKIPTLIFDEIDANIGGATAVVVGEKFKEIAVQHQVLCITHFPQVAKLAEHHLRIMKKEIDGRTVTLVDALDHVAHQQELMRMLGGAALLKP
jgi:DNA repair protein RecN (Recombination protein N)